VKRNIALYLKDILGNIAHAESFSAEMSYDEFRRDTKTVYAVIRCLEVLGEASKNIPTALRRKYPYIPWKEMAGMRDRLIHAYFGVDPQKVWLVLKEDLPRIKPEIERVLKDYSKD
jgi:uncharacterized protein with HEPN domain